MANLNETGIDNRVRTLESTRGRVLAYQILCKSNDRRRSYDVILILQDGGHSVANLLPVSDLVTPEI